VPELADAVVSFHGQDDLGLATANALAAIRAGARQVELAVNGIGERAGNTAFEEVVMAISVHGAALGVHTAVDARGICALSALVERHSGVAVPRNKAVVGANAFRHASGIHQDGVLKWRENYEVLDPRRSATRAAPRSCWASSPDGRVRPRARGSSASVLSDAGSTTAFDRFQRVADDQPVVEDDELRSICAGV
jgi:2-isopropylmalate synthase